MLGAPGVYPSHLRGFLRFPALLLLSGLEMKIEKYRQVYVKLANIRFNKSTFSGLRVVACEQLTDVVELIAIVIC